MSAFIMRQSMPFSSPRGSGISDRGARPFRPRKDRDYDDEPEFCCDTLPPLCGVTIVSIVLAAFIQPTIGALVWLAGLVATMLIRAPYYHHASKSRSLVLQDDDSVDRALVVATGFFTGITPIVWIIFPSLLASFEHSPWSNWIWYFGSVLQIAYVVLFNKAHEELDKNWSQFLRIRENHTLVTTGVYSSIRHPFYAITLIGIVSQTILLTNWLCGPAALVTFAALCYRRIPVEENMMLEHFEDDYEDYCSETKQLIPLLY